MRTLIIGLPGSGKTTLAKILSRNTRVPHYEMDRYFWLDDEVENPDFRRECEKIAHKGEWICEGHFTKVHPYFLAKAERIIWLKTPWSVCLNRVFQRVVAHQAPLSRLQFFLQHSHENQQRFETLLRPFMHCVTIHDSPLYSIDEI